MQGIQGLQGPVGATGAPGPAGSGGILPYSSGQPITLTIQSNGSPGKPVMLAFGSYVTAKENLASVLDISDAAHLAFLVPRDLIITDLNALFSFAGGSALPNNAAIFAELYRASSSHLFTPVPYSQLSLSPPVCGCAEPGTLICGGLRGLHIHVSQGERLLLLFYAGGARQEATAATSVTGYASASFAYH